MLTLNKVVLRQGDFSLTADLRVAAGEVTAVIGPSGGGKSTLLGAVAGFVTVQSGTVLWEDRNLTDVPPGKRPVTMLFQDNNLFPHLTVTQNIGLGMRPDMKLTPADHAKIEAALLQVGLQGFGGRKPAALSGGQQSRVALARVLVSARPLVLLDEPFAALGPALKQEMLALVRDVLIKAGKTVVMVTHDPADAMAVAKNLVLVADGVAHAAVDVVTGFENPTPALKAYLGGS